MHLWDNARAGRDVFVASAVSLRPDRDDAMQYIDFAMRHVSAPTLNIAQT